jgi:hypothetical protein
MVWNVLPSPMPSATAAQTAAGRSSHIWKSTNEAVVTRQPLPQHAPQCSILQAGVLLLGCGLESVHMCFVHGVPSRTCQNCTVHALLPHTRQALKHKPATKANQQAGTDSVGACGAAPLKMRQLCLQSATHHNLQHTGYDSIIRAMTLCCI